MTNYGFTLHVDGIPESDDGFLAFANALFEHAPDCTPGGLTVGFDRDAENLRDAVVSAVESVRRADPSVTVVGAVLDDGRRIDSLLPPAATAAGQ